MKRRTSLIAGVSAIALVLATAFTAFAYTGQVKGSLSISIKATPTCGGPVTATATLLDADGLPIVGQSVAWSFVTTQSSKDKIVKTPTTTDAKGVATTTLTLAAVEGTRKIRATVVEGTADQVSATAVIDVRCGGLPNTSTIPVEKSGSGAPLAAALLVALAFAVGGGLMLRRRAATRS